MHEAHRHPYIERLAQMYLLRFHHREQFGNRACAAWRQVFVLLLMPWMRKHRVSRQVRIQQSLKSLTANRLIAVEQDKNIVERFGEDVHNAAVTTTAIAKDFVEQTADELVDAFEVSGATAKVAVDTATQGLSHAMKQGG